MKRSDQISIIGFGSMGSMLAEGFLRTNTLEESQIKIFTRTRKKANSFVRDNPDVIVYNSLQKCVEDTSIIIICIPPNESINVLHDIKQHATANQIIVSIVGSLTIDIIQKILPQKIVRMVPSITAEIDEGTFIISSNNYCSDRDTNKIYRLFSYLGEVIEVPESKIEIFTDLTSCSPGILSAIFQEYINSAIRVGKVSRKQALKVFIQTLYGLSKLYYEENNDFEDIISRVARKGGTTEVGINLVQENLPGCFDKIFMKTLEHQKKRKDQLKKSLT